MNNIFRSIQINFESSNRAKDKLFSQILYKFKALIIKERGKGLSSLSDLAWNSGRKDRKASDPRKETVSDIACNSPTRRAVAKAIRNNTFLVRSLKVALRRGSKGGRLMYSKTLAKSQEGALLGMEGLSNLNDLVRPWKKQTKTLV